MGLALAGLVFACANPSAFGDEVWSEPIGLELEAPRGQVELLAAFRLRSSLGDFGGLSGATLSEDGTLLSAVSDRGGFFHLRLRRDSSEKLEGVELASHGRLVGIDGQRLVGRNTDAEELARDSRGFWVAFERFHRVRLYRNGLDHPPELVALPDDVRHLPENTGIEAMAALPGGNLLLLAEAVVDGRAPLWIGGAGGWRKSFYEPRPGYSPTGAAALPDGSILVLERQFSLFGGFSALLSMARPPEHDGAGWSRREILHLDGAWAENFEAVAFWRDRSGRFRADLLTDDNFSPFQSTLLLEVRLP